jgi:hypothetical protein
MFFINISKISNSFQVYVLHVRLYIVLRIKVDFKESDLFLTLVSWCIDMNGSKWKDKRQV